MKASQLGRNIFTSHVVTCLALVNLLLFSSEAIALDRGKPIRVVAFGDSLTAGYMLKPTESFPAQLSAALQAKGRNVEVVNAGVSGDTMAQGLERLDWSVPEGTEAVIVELGANDALRGIDPKETRAILDKILTQLRARKIEVLVAGMLAPKNWGPEYEQAFNAMYKDLAEKHDALLYPFFLDGVATDRKLNLSDGLHPNAAGVGVIVERMMPSMLDLLARVEARRVAATPQ